MGNLISDYCILNLSEELEGGREEGRLWEIQTEGEGRERERDMDNIKVYLE